MRREEESSLREKRKTRNQKIKKKKDLKRERNSSCTVICTVVPN
jgi:hypothetical protein